MRSCAELTEIMCKRNDAAKQSTQAPDPGQAMFRSEDSQEANASTSTRHVRAKGPVHSAHGANSAGSCHTFFEARCSRVYRCTQKNIQKES